MDIAKVLQELKPVEWWAVILTAIGVWLTVKADIRNFIVGIAAVLLYSYIFWTGKLYANFALNLLFYLPMQFVGWYVWLRTGPNKDDDLPIRRMSFKENLLWVGVTAVLTLAWGYLLGSLTDGKIPFWDAATTALCVVAQILLTRKCLENWIYWIVVDIVYVFYLFPSQHLYLSTGLYFILMLMSIKGFLDWLKAHRKGAVYA